MGRHDQRQPSGPAQLAKERFDPLHVRRVEPREGLVAEDDLGIHDDRPGQGDAAEHPARELAGEQVVDALQSDGGESFLHGVADLVLSELRVLPERQGDVLEHRHGVEQGAFLEEHAETPAHPLDAAARQRCHVFSGDSDMARVRSLQAADHPQHGTLARAAAPHQDGDLRARETAGETFEDHPLTEREVDGLELHMRRLCR